MDKQRYCAYCVRPFMVHYADQRVTCGNPVCRSRTTVWNRWANDWNAPFLPPSMSAKTAAQAFDLVNAN